MDPPPGQPAVVGNPGAIPRQFAALLTLVFKTVQVDLYPGAMQGPDLVKNIYDSAVVGWPGNVEGDDMEAERRHLEESQNSKKGLDISE